MKLLELFSGTGSVGAVAKQLGFDVVSLDLKKADINIDILKWDYKIFAVGYFDVIHASPPCTEYSIALTTRARDITKANEIVLKCLEIIEYLKPQYYIIENPQSGLLKSQPFMLDIPYKDIDYCKYGMTYRKRTRIWSNIIWIAKPLCKKDCGNTIGNRHISRAQKGRDIRTITDINYIQCDLYVIPVALIYDILKGVV